ncbi:HAD-IIB family hydrolase [Halorubellus sp. JP-L1]|uniref:HAD-IIB family hydrolase n=1 Tax=Halorubellus sp. JP-L1 TaxID=2715753 RepID=UPI00140AD987|nr:HAD-IIB family hydrolase [Halorubellus sp. JP-L1]NHN41077.1 HAD-IIB family hydrolase [Halorubellus sp. JP-L1]
MSGLPPLALDIDGTLTRPSGHGVDPRVFDPVRDWPEPVVLATGKAFPYPIALSDFLDVPHLVVAENGGVVVAGDDVHVHDAGARIDAIAEAFRERGGDLGWGDADLVNRWRETELAVRRDAPADLLRDLADEYDLAFVDTGYAYHVKPREVSKGKALDRVAAHLDLAPEDFVAVGDSENDVSTFERVDHSYAVANADEKAKAAATVVLDDAHADGTLAALDDIRANDA